MQQPSTSPECHILEPVEMSLTARSLRRLETEFVESYFKIKKQLDERRPLFNQPVDFSRAYSLTDEGQTHTVATFGSVEKEILPKLYQLRQALRQLEYNVLECEFQITNENDCSQLWTRLEAIKNQTQSVEDALGDFGSRIAKMRRWSHKYHMPACAKFYSRVDDANSEISDLGVVDGKPPMIDPDAVPHPPIIDIDAIPETLATVLQGIVNHNATIQYSITFYKACMVSMRNSVQGFLRAIPGGTFSLDQLIIWGRLAYFSLNDISQGLASFPQITKKMAPAAS